MHHPAPTRAERPPVAATLIYDGECGFCCASARWLERHTAADLQLLTFDEVPGSGLLTSLSAAEVARSAHYVTPDGIEYHGGASVTRALRRTRLGWLGRLLDLPALSPVRDIGYAAVDRARPLLSRLVRGEPCRSARDNA